MVKIQIFYEILKYNVFSIPLFEGHLVLKFRMSGFGLGSGARTLPKVIERMGLYYI